jgi:bifunctional DNA-binding transcriptional regulator/antitoxin component of YhaV-PrlF toxin-antitoxin module
VSVQQRSGTVTIPVQARRALGLDRPGAQVEVVLRDGELVLVPYIAVPTQTAWFWTEGHQSAEREADADLGLLAVSSGFGDQIGVDPAWRVDEGVMVSLGA